MKNRELSIYLHIPFCIRKCHYCDFLSFPAGCETREGYLEALLAEIRLEAVKYPQAIVKTIFFGGGTPSLLEPEQIQRIMSCLCSCFCLDDLAEISMEVNPGTVDLEKLQGYRAAGINRLSIGLQSVNDKELNCLGRIHNYDTFLETYRGAVRCGFTNINIDLMFALPGQTVDSYCQGLKKVLALDPPPTHISAYSLIVEEGTDFWDWAEQGKLQLPTEEEEREMYDSTGAILKAAGYHRYEISNYAREGFACRHNLVYWDRGNYLGLGLGAASLIDNLRTSNEEDLEDYIRRMQCGGEKPRKQRLSTQEQMEETMFLGLRKMEGVSRKRFRELYGCEMEEVYGAVVQRHVKNGLLRDGDFVALTERGIDVSNRVMADFLLESDGKGT